MKKDAVIAQWEHLTPAEPWSSEVTEIKEAALVAENQEQEVALEAATPSSVPEVEID